VVSRPEAADPTAVLEVDRESSAPAKTYLRVPVEGAARDADGALIGILVHVVDGYLSELEYVRYDGDPMLRVPDADQVAVSVNG
jgi:hypothetical protein